MYLVFKYEKQLIQISMIQRNNFGVNFVRTLNVNFHYDICTESVSDTEKHGHKLLITRTFLSLGCDTIWSTRSLPLFQRSMLPDGGNRFLWNVGNATRLHGIISQRTIIFIVTIERTSNTHETSYVMLYVKTGNIKWFKLHPLIANLSVHY
jgi:hypothetical protein